MFSGLIAHSGAIAAVAGSGESGVTLTIEAPDAIADGVAIGDSVAVNGVCLTVVAWDARTMRFDVVPETIRRAAFDSLHAGELVNLELSLRMGDRLGGHLVYGHVDANAAVIARVPQGQGHWLTIELPPALRPFIVEKGYVTIDGVSLTVAEVTTASFAIALIPETSRRTTLGVKKPGDRVTLEVDPVARYVQGALDAYGRRDG